MTVDVFLNISAAGVPLDAVLEAQNRLASELNERAPIAEAVVQRTKRGMKGVATELVGQLGVALLSPLVIKYIAQVIIEFVKRNEQYKIKVRDIVICKERASDKDMERINKLLLEILVKKSNVERKR